MVSGEDFPQQTNHSIETSPAFVQAQRLEGSPSEVHEIQRLKSKRLAPPAPGRLKWLNVGEKILESYWVHSK